MSASSRPRRSRTLLATFVLLTGTLGAGWWIQRQARLAALDEALAPWGSHPLPGDRRAPVDSVLAGLGARVFETRCASCHGLTGSEGKLGPSLLGVTERRSLPWVTAMILDPDSMTRSDPVAQALLQEYGVQMMVPGGMDLPRTRAVVEFLRQVDRRN